MNNKPVAWMELYYGEPNNLSWTDAELRDSGEVYKTIPLYTHPVKELKNIVVASATCSCGKVMEVTNLQPVKELTDEEIKQIFVEESGFDVDTCPIAIMDFARAILRKAQYK